MSAAEESPPVDPSGSRILLTGASGYVGGRLLSRLAADGRPLRCMSRRPTELRAHVPPGIEVVHGDVSEPASLGDALRDVAVAYYLVHSMAGTADYRESDRAGAEAFGRAAREAGVARIVYLGGLGHGPDLSDHLTSRQEVGRALAASGVPTLELRASVVIGSGSTSFEMIRALVDRLPVMITPRWVSTATQPIAIEDLVEYLVQAAETPLPASAVVEIGGPEPVSYGELMSRYARRRGLRRLMIPVPVLTPRLSGLWLGLVTPVYARVGRELVEGLRNETTVRDDAARRMFTVRPRGLAEAIDRAIVNEDREFAETRWSDAVSSSPARRRFGGQAAGARRFDSRTARVLSSPERTFAAVERIGGRNGWYHADALWRLRGLLDLPFGGAGTRRGRRDPERLLPGDTVDFWRVETIEPGRLLRLRAEMWVPGRAWLQFEVEPADGGCLLRQTAIFDPAGLLGRLYWYAVWPVHGLVFAGMIAGIARAAEGGPAAAGTGTVRP